MIEFRNINQPLELWQIFHQECLDNTIALDEILKQLPSSNAEIADENFKRKLSARFHRLKGSLGFLGFKEYADHVKDLEDELKEKNTCSSVKIIHIQSELQILSKDLGELINT